MNNGKIAGKLMGIQIADNFISCETESTLNFERDMLPKDSVISGRWMEYITGKGNWQMTVNGLLLKREVGADFKTLYRSFINGDLLNIYFRTRIGVDQFMIWQGNAYVMNGGANAPINGMANWNITFRGVGPLSFDWEEYWTIIDSMPADELQPNIVDTRDWEV